MADDDASTSRRPGRIGVALILLWVLAAVSLVTGTILLIVDQGSVAGYGWTAYPPLSSVTPDYLSDPVLTVDLGYLLLLVGAAALIGALVVHGVRGAIRAEFGRRDAG